MKNLTILICACLAWASVVRAADAVFVVHPDTAVSTLSREDIKNILLGNKTKWDAGGNIKLAVLSTGAAHEAVMQNYAARSADQFEKYWKKLVFTGKGAAPDSFSSEADLLAFVAKTPGAFGYVTAGSAPAGVKVIQSN